jgi:hypothetical protein
MIYPKVMEYNTERSKLVIAEYGRNIQKMIDYTTTIEDREKRTKAAKVIVNIMAQMNPHIRENEDYMHKLWDHLYYISDFKLDVDSPYPPPQKDTFQKKPERIPYSDNKITFRHYGKYVEKMIEKISEMENGEEKDYLIQIIANHLKKSYLNWNRDSVNDETIFKHLEELSGGRLKLTDDQQLLSTNEILSRNRPAKRKSSNYRKDNNKRRNYNQKRY